MNTFISIIEMFNLNNFYIIIFIFRLFTMSISKIVENVNKSIMILFKPLL